MTKYIEVSARTEDDAIASGLAQLGLTRDEVSVEILERSKRGVLGLGHTDAKVRISYEAPDEPEKIAEPVSAPAPEKKPAAFRFAS